MSHTLLPRDFAMFDAATLAPLLNAYTVSAGTVNSIAVPHASALTGFLEVTISGRLLPKQVVALDVKTGQRTVSQLGDGTYRLSSDGDCHLCLGTAAGSPHIACEVQRAKPFLTALNAAVGQAISVTGFFRSLFEHPGFLQGDDAHIFEVHPVRALSIGAQVMVFDVGIPDQASIHTWSSPHDLNQQDNAIRVALAGDTLTYSNMVGTDENYVRVMGTITNVQIPDALDGPARFTFTSGAIGRPLGGMCLQGTNALKQLAGVADGGMVSMIALRSIDLAASARGEYVIALLGIDIQELPAAAPAR